MKSKLINVACTLILSLFFIKTLCAQNYNYSLYHYKVNIAELKIADRKIAEALQLYDSLFSVFPYHFDTDLYNASVCALILKKYDKVFEYSKRIIENGNHGISFFEEKAAYKEFRKKDEWSHFVNLCLHYEKQVVTETNNYFINLRDSLNKAEQEKSSDFLEFNIAVYNSTKVLFETFLSNPDFLRFMFTGKVNDYAPLMRHYYVLQGAIADNLTNQEHNTFFDTLIIDSYNLDSIYRIALNKGYLHPSVYSNAYFGNTVKNKYINPKIYVFIFIDSAEIIVFKPEEDEIRLSDSIRSILLLPQLEDQLYKIKKTDILLNNYPLKEYRKIIKKLENDKEYLKLENEEQLSIFVNAINTIEDNAIAKLIENYSDGLYYSFSFSRNPLTFIGDNPCLPTQTIDSRSFIIDLYNTVSKTSKRLR